MSEVPTLELILGRRSFRGPYADRSVAHETIEKIVQCGLSSPSSKNAQPWRFHVVTDRVLLERLARSVAEADRAGEFVPIDPNTGKPRTDWDSTVAESADALGAAPVAIFIENRGAFSSGRATIAAAPSELLEENLFTYSLELIGLGTAVMNMWIATRSLGAEAVFMGDICVAEKIISQALSLDCDLAGVLLVGYPAEPINRRAPPLLDENAVIWR